VEVEMRLVFRAAITANAASVIVLHNHPTDNVSPSEADLTCAHRLMAAGRFLGVMVKDFVIVTRTAFSSFHDEGLLSIEAEAMQDRDREKSDDAWGVVTEELVGSSPSVKHHLYALATKLDQPPAAMVKTIMQGVVVLARVVIEKSD
jgi:hypothetical protein